MSCKVKNGCLVQRLVIFHLGLLPGKLSDGFDESASNEELCEHILYYNDQDKAYPTDHRCRYNFDEAIKFAGLCSALYSLQSTIDGQMNQNGEKQENPDESQTKEVYLSTCTLVFIPLDSSEIEGVVAVAQLPKPSMTAKKSKRNDLSNSITPEQIRRKHMKAHDLFKLMNGGGIHLRLSNCPGDVTSREENSGEHADYVGMAELYKHLKKLRKLQLQRQNIQNISDDDEQRIEENIRVVEGQLNDCTTVLPIDALRLDLRQFYDSFLRDIAVSEC